MKKLLFIILFYCIANAATLDFSGHIGMHGQSNLTSKNNTYAGLNANIDLDISFENNLELGFGGYAAIPIYEASKNFTSNIYSNTLVLSSAYFAYDDEDFIRFYIGRYDTNDLEYNWFSGYNEGASLSLNLADVVRLWSLYSFEQAFNFLRANRDIYGGMNALWDFRRHRQYNQEGIRSSRRGQLFAGGLDLYTNGIDDEGARFSPYIYYVNNNLVAYGLRSVASGDIISDMLYGIAMLDFVYVDSNPTNGSLLWLDIEFGHQWLGFGGGYYKAFKNGIGRLIEFGDNSRFYGSIVSTNRQNLGGEYFTNNQSTWYLFLKARHNDFKIDLLYADGGYKEISAFASLTLFDFFEFGGGYVGLSKLENIRRHIIAGFAKAIW